MPTIDELKAIALKLKSERALEVAVAERQSSRGPTGEVVFACYAGGGRAPYTAASLLLQAIGTRSQKISDIVTTEADRLEMATGMYQMVYGPGDHVIHADSSATPAPEVRLTELDGQSVIARDSLDEFELPVIKLDPVTGGISGDSTSNIHRIYMLAAYALLHKQKTGQVGDGLQVAAVMVNRQGVIVACGINTNRENCTYHAEVNLLQSLFRRNKDNLMPGGARIYTTLQPCQMCAGMIYNCRNTRDAADPLVFYGQIDPGQLRKTTALSTAHLERLLSHTQSVSHFDEFKRARGAAVAGGPKAVKLYYQQSDDPVPDLSRNLEEREQAFEGTAAGFGERINTNAVLYTLQRKFLRNDSPNTYAIRGKTVNPLVRRTVNHVVAFLGKMQIPLPTIERREIRGTKWD